MNQIPLFNVGFHNDEWKDEWGIWVPGMEGKQKYADGNYSMDADGTIHVFDGATNFRGDILADGTFVPNNGRPTGNAQIDAMVNEMNMTFLRAAKNAKLSKDNVIFADEVISDK